MQQLPFGKPGRWYRGNLHTHSTRSDGSLDPAAVVAAYRDQGYDFVAITDHFLAQFGFPLTDTRSFRTATFTTLLGAELHTAQIESGGPYHLVAVGLPLDFAPTLADETAPALAARAQAAGAFVGIAHPARSNLTLDDALLLETADAIEIYNQGSALSLRANSWHLCDQLLLRGRHVFAFAADDAHVIDPAVDSFSAWVEVRAASLTPEALLAALKVGHYYSTQGPQLHTVAIEQDTLRIQCSPAASVVVSGTGMYAHHIHGVEVTDCAFSLEPFRGSFCRVTVADASGKCAWSNPIWLH